MSMVKMWLMAGAVVLVCAGCSVNARSDDYTCNSPADCSTGRVCDNGWCVVATSVCPDECSFCDVDGRCVIACDFVGACSSVQCPPGRPCEVRCGSAAACSDLVDCTAATECDIKCSGLSSCGGDVLCGSGRCNVTCDGQASCSGEVDCASSCACDMYCTGQFSCTGDSSCPRGAMCTTDGVCRSSSQGACSRC